MKLLYKIVPGQRFGNLVSIEKKTYPFWLFRCKCGKLKRINKYDVIYGKTRSCGCLTVKMRSSTKLAKLKKSIQGREVGKLKIIHYAYTKNYKTYWKVRCSCGKIFTASLGNILSGSIRSCGCLRTHKYPPGYSGLKKVFLSYKKSAKREKRVFSLSFEDVKKLTSSKCFYCGQSPQRISQSNRTADRTVMRYTRYKYNGIDRIDSRKGYELTNVVSCCSWCNIMKRERTLDDFKNHIGKIYNHILSENNDSKIVYLHGDINPWLKRVFNIYIYNAKSRNISFDLSLDDVKSVVLQNCFYCGTQPQLILKNYSQYKYNSIDRVNSSEGYTRKNIVPCCKWCNIAKSNRSVQEFWNHIIKIYNHLNIK